MEDIDMEKVEIHSQGSKPKMTETTISNHSQALEHKKKKKRHFLYFFIPFFIAGNIGFYFQERAKWIYPKQPYPEAKEWLVPANMMLVYGTILTKLPFIDERSFIMKPIIGLQDYFVSKWQENLPDDDAEKYVGWYIFRLRTYMVPNANSVVLYTDDTYSHDETREANEKAWQTIEAMAKYKAKDSEFNEIRYAAFLNLSFLYLENSSLYWVRKNKFKYFFDIDMMFQDRERMSRFYRLYDYIITIDEYYKKQYPAIFQKLVDKYYKNHLTYQMTDYILRDLLESKDRDIKKICNDKNRYFRVHFDSKKVLLEIYKDEQKNGKQSIDKLINGSNDKKMFTICKIQGEVR